MGASPSRLSGILRGGGLRRPGYSLDARRQASLPGMSDPDNTTPQPGPDGDGTGARTPATHDIGGLGRYRCTPVERDDEAPPDAFGKRVDALRQLMAAKGFMTVDELRRGIEAIPEEEYFDLTYYERWLRSITAILLEKGVVSAEELR